MQEELPVKELMLTEVLGWDSDKILDINFSIRYPNAIDMATHMEDLWLMFQCLLLP